MDCEDQIFFSEPMPSFLDDDVVFADIYRDLASWHIGANMQVDDADFPGLMFCEPVIEAPSDDNDHNLGAMAPPESEPGFQEMNPMVISDVNCDEFQEFEVGEAQIEDGNHHWLESYLDNLLDQDAPERDELIQSFGIPVDPVASYVGETAPCWDLKSDLWTGASAGVDASRVFGGNEVKFERNMECMRTRHEHAQDLIIHQQGYQFCVAQDVDILGYGMQGETEEINQAVQDLSIEYQPVLQEAEGEYFGETLPYEAAPELGPSVMLIDLPEDIPSTSKESDQQRHGSRKRGRETLVVDHNGVSMRYDGSEERFTAYYRPSYWTEDDSCVFLGEYPTQEEAADAHNLVALLHEGREAQIILPYTANRYADELKRWEGKHHVDLVCELRLRGRGLLKDGTVNYKHVGRRWSGKKKGTRYFSTVSDDPVSSRNAKTGKPKRTFLTTFDTPEEAARYADQVLVKRKGPEAWTNFPLSSYVTSPDELPLSFLPISNNFRDNLTYKRAKA